MWLTVGKGNRVTRLIRTSLTLLALWLWKSYLAFFEPLFLHQHLQNKNDNNTILLRGIPKKQMWWWASEYSVDPESTSAKISLRGQCTSVCAMKELYGGKQTKKFLIHFGFLKHSASLPSPPFWKVSTALYSLSISGGTAVCQAIHSQQGPKQMHSLLHWGC